MEKELKEKRITLDEIIANPKFFTFVQSVISELKLKRYGRPKPKQGFHYKRDWYDRMSSNNTFNANFFVENIKDVWSKKSNLGSEFRNVIIFICGTALQQTIDELKLKL